MRSRRFTTREVEVLEAIAEAGTTKGATYALHMHAQTMKNHLNRMRTKAGAVSTMQLMFWYGRGDLRELMP